MRSAVPSLRRRPHPPAALAFALGLLAACGGGSRPTAADLPELLREASGAAPEPSWGDSDERAAVRSSLRTMHRLQSMHEAEMAERFQRHELDSYFLRSESFVGGTWPQKTAALLREAERQERTWLDEVAGYRDVLDRALAQAGLSDGDRAALADEMARAYAADRAPLVAFTEAHRRFVAETARLYEIAAANPEAFKAMRTGLEIDDDGLLAGFNGQVDAVNAAREAAQSSLAGLREDDVAAVRRMRLVEIVMRQDPPAAR